MSDPAVSVPTPEVSIEDKAQAVSETVHDLADLIARGGRILGKLGRTLQSAEKVTGPMSRPIVESDLKR